MVWWSDNRRIRWIKGLTDVDELRSSWIDGWMDGWMNGCKTC